MDILTQHRLNTIEEKINGLEGFNIQVMKGQAIDYEVVLKLSWRVKKLENMIERMQEEINLIKTTD